MSGLRIHAEHAALLRCGEKKGFGQLKGQLVGRDLVVEVGSLRFGFAILAGDHPLQVWAVLTHPNHDRPAFLVVEQLDGVDFSGIDAFEVDTHQLLEATGAGDRVGHTMVATEVEVGQPVGAPLLPGGDLVELVLHGGGEVVIHQAAEVLFQQTGHRERHPGRHQRAALLVDVAAVLNRLDDRGIR